MNPETRHDGAENRNEKKENKLVPWLKRIGLVALGGLAFPGDADIEVKAPPDLGAQVDPRKKGTSEPEETEQETPPLDTPQSPMVLKNKDTEPKDRIEHTKFKQRKAVEKNPTPEPTEKLPEHLQTQVEELQNMCDEYMHAEPAEILNPMRPPIHAQIWEHYMQFLDNPDRAKYESTKYRLLDSFCGDMKKVRERAMQLLRDIEQLPLSEYEKSKIFENLMNGASVFPGIKPADVGDLWDTYAGATSLLPVSKNGETTYPSEEKINDAYTFYRQAFEHLSHPEKLMPEERAHLARILRDSKADDQKYDFFTDEERESMQLFERDFLVLPNLIKEYKEFMALSEQPPKNTTDIYAYHQWRKELWAKLAGIVGSMEHYGIDPEQIGSAYSWDGLLEMLEEYRKLSNESHDYIQDYQLYGPPQEEK